MANSPKRFLGPAALVCLALVLLLVPYSQTARWQRALVDLGHAPLFFVLTWGWGRRLLKSPSGRMRLLLVGILVGGFGLLTEAAQGWVGRHPSWHDVSANLLGTTAGVLWLWGAAGSPAKIGLRILAGGLLGWGLVPPLLVLADAIGQHSQTPTLASFENRLELSRWTLQDCEIQRVQQHQTAGEWALQVDLGTGTYPGLSLEDFPPDWTPYRELGLDVTLESPSSLRLIVKLTDEIHNWEPEDRFHLEVLLRGGLNRIRIPLMFVRDAPENRRMDLSRMKMLQLFTIGPRKPARIFLDNIRLIPHPPEGTRVREDSGFPARAERD